MKQLVKRGIRNDLSGRRFGRLQVLEYIVSCSHGNSVWMCRCDCGSSHTVAGCRLVTGMTNSCGCLQRERTSARFKTHGCARSGKITPEFKAWNAMRYRCRGDWHPDYGGRGIRVCQRWDESFEAFLEDMGNRTSDLHSLDRIDVNGHYEPGNCRWALQKVQQRNRRNHRRLTCNGQSKTIGEWCEITGMRFKTISDRLKRGWSVEKALFQPPGKNGRKKAVV